MALTFKKLSSTADPVYAYQHWKSVFLGDQQSPGLASVTVSSARDVETKKPKGKDKATLTDHGKKLSTVTISLHVPREEGDDLFKFIAAISPSTHSVKSPLEIVHPQTLMAGVKTVYVQEVDLKGFSPQNGFTVDIKCVEWAKAPSKSRVTGTPKAAGKSSGSGTNKKPKNDPGKDLSDRVAAAHAAGLRSTTL